MSEPIKKGDLVYVAEPQPCCGNADFVGQVFMVSGVLLQTSNCCYCGHEVTESFAYGKSDGRLTKISRLRKIDPPATGEYDRVPVRKTVPA